MKFKILVIAIISIMSLQPLNASTTIQSFMREEIYLAAEYDEEGNYKDIRIPCFKRLIPSAFSETEQTVMELNFAYGKGGDAAEYVEKLGFLCVRQTLKEFREPFDRLIVNFCYEIPYYSKTSSNPVLGRVKESIQEKLGYLSGKEKLAKEIIDTLEINIVTTPS